MDGPSRSSSESAARDEDETDSPRFLDELGADLSRPSSRASSGGRLSPAPDAAVDMENVQWDELPAEKIYEYFSHAVNMAGVLRAFEALKTKLGVGGARGLELFRSLKDKLNSQKTWKARDVLGMLDKRANQQEYMRHKAAEGTRVMIGRRGRVCVCMCECVCEGLCVYVCVA